MMQIRILAGSTSSVMKRVWAVVNEDKIEKITPYLGSRSNPLRMYVPDGSGRVEETEVRYLRLYNGNEMMMHPDDVKRFFPEFKVGDFTSDEFASERGEISNDDPEPEPAEQVTEGMIGSVPFQTEVIIGPGSSFQFDRGTSAPTRPTRDPRDLDDGPF